MYGISLNLIRLHIYDPQGQQYRPINEVKHLIYILKTWNLWLQAVSLGENVRQNEEGGVT